MMTLRDIISVIEAVAPLTIQDDFDNSGLQVGSRNAEISKILVCLDITEDIVEEAKREGCNLIVSHHPLIFHKLGCVSDLTYQQRCITAAIRSGIAVYSAHTSLDNAPGGVNYKIASLIGLENCRWLSDQSRDSLHCGSGLVGELPKALSDKEFAAFLADTFKVECLQHSECKGKLIRRVALCGGAGAFLLKNAIECGADSFVCGEFHYHDYFENHGVFLAELGHYQSEQFTVDLLSDILSSGCTGVSIIKTSINTNPIRYYHK